VIPNQPKGPHHARRLRPSPWSSQVPRPGPSRPDARSARVWWQEPELDAALAGGADPSKTEELVLRARKLVEPRKRGELAAALDRLVEIAERPREGAARIPPYPPLRPKQVEANRSLLSKLARRLRCRGPHGLRGLAMTSLMLEDSTRSRCIDSEPAMLEHALRGALSALDVRR
jgi:hypothetical protein